MNSQLSQQKQMRCSPPQNTIWAKKYLIKTARIKHDAAPQPVMTDLPANPTDQYRQFSDNPSFSQSLGGSIFNMTFQKPDKFSPEANHVR